ncbi:MAG: hypothetical protein MK193_06585 [Lentisphaeria bacterium]|nr:hypothetical protein [Lentisphaeria bacterium]
MKKVLMAALTCVASITYGLDAEVRTKYSITDQVGEIKGTNGAKLTKDGEDTIIEVPSKFNGVITILPKSEYFDFSGYNGFVFDWKNESEGQVKVKIRIDNKGALDWAKCALIFTYLDAGKQKGTFMRFHRNKTMVENATSQFPDLAFTKMNGTPSGFFMHWLTVDLTKVTHIRINVLPQNFRQKIRIKDLSLIDKFEDKSKFIAQDGFYPFIDKYGQYKHAEWPGKIKSDADLKAATEKESADLEANPEMPNRNKFGSWSKGQQREATGFFRTEKIDGKWWLVDPEGYLFWSNGVTCVGAPNAETDIESRPKYFELSDEDKSSPFYKKHRKSGIMSYDHTRANLLRKYGPNWRNISLDLAHKRLKSWGLNTIGMWSDDDLMLMQRTPYTVAVHYGYESSGDKFPDVFHPDFPNWVGDAIEAKKAHFNDPWCLGFFINNELHWKHPKDFANILFKENEKHYGKQAMIKYLSVLLNIEDFAKATGKNFANWDEVLKTSGALNLDDLEKPISDFYTIMAEKYFKVCHDELEKRNPNTLYLGARMHVYRPLVFKAAEKYCDIVSLNLYEFSIAGYARITTKPFISSEFHFGAYDRGMFGSGLKWASDQDDRAQLYHDYVKGALQNSSCVGVHWFQYSSQSFTGRGDGENYQVGMMDIADNPYPEFRDAMREASREMYETRAK